MKPFNRLLLINIALLLILFVPIQTQAGTCDCGPGLSFPAATQADCPSTYQSENFTATCTFSSDGIGSTSQPDGSTVLENPLGTNDPRVIIGNVIKVILGIVGSITLAIFIYGGLLWMTSSGNTERIKRGRDTLVWATIGFMVILGSYTVVNFVIQSITKPPTGG